jgi:hypothetical protein
MLLRYPNIYNEMYSLLLKWMGHWEPPASVGAPEHVQFLGAHSSSSDCGASATDSTCRAWYGTHSSPGVPIGRCESQWRQRNWLVAAKHRARPSLCCGIGGASAELPSTSFRASGRTKTSASCRESIRRSRNQRWTRQTTTSVGFDSWVDQGNGSIPWSWAREIRNFECRWIGEWAIRWFQPEIRVVSACHLWNLPWEWWVPPRLCSARD